MVSDVSATPAAGGGGGALVAGLPGAAAPLQVALAGAARVPLPPRDDGAPPQWLGRTDRTHRAVGNGTGVLETGDRDPRAERLLGRAALEALWRSEGSGRQNPRRGGHDVDPPRGGPRRRANEARSRSEEHTSELQSPCNLVCR